MMLADLLSNEELRRQEFPVVREKNFLAHAGVCPLPFRVSEAIRAYATQATEGDQEATGPGVNLRETRALAARLLSAEPEEIALVGPTSLALSYVASGFPFRKGDNVLVYQDDYPSNVYPWMALAAKGVEVRFLNLRELGRIRALDVQGQVDEQTRLVALASCHFLAGWRIDLAGIGQFLHARGIAFCVDAIQTAGAFPTNVEHVDFLAADAHKWLLGPCAAGILYVNKSWHEKLCPPVYGWHNVRCPDFVAQEQIEFASHARRYEVGTANLLGLAGLHAALELVLEIGVDQIAAELLRKRAWLVPALRAKGWNVLQAEAPSAHASAILSLHRKDADLLTMHRRLEESGIIVSLRADRTGQRYLRLSPHFYNTDTELARVVEML